MNDPKPLFLARRRFLAAAVAAVCASSLLHSVRALEVFTPAMPGGPFELPLAAADLYAPHDLAG